MYNAGFNLDVLRAAMEFALKLPAGSSSFLKGYSTNYPLGFAVQPQDDIVEQSRNPAPTFAAPSGYFTPTIRTALEVNSVIVTVSSRDYGGLANLSAKATIDGFILNADIVDRDNPQIDVTPPPCKGTGSFASLPVDKIVTASPTVGRMYTQPITARTFRRTGTKSLAELPRLAKRRWILGPR